MELAILIVLLCLEPILSTQNLTWEDYQKINLIKNMTITEIHYRRKVYRENLAKIKEHNEKFQQGLVSYTLEMNQFGHLTEEEFLNKYTGGKERDTKTLERIARVYDAPKHVILPEAVDWRLEGVVTPTKSQKDCGSCYIFGSVATIESHYAIKHKKLVELSEQQILDCSRNWGCGGGTIVHTYEYVRNIGLTTRASYPYEEKLGFCRAKKHEIVVKLKKFERINPHSVYSLQAAVALHGPVTVSVNCTGWRFASAKQVIRGNWCGAKSPTDHIVSVVGYNTTEKGIPYWIVKNSWGETWGDEGYLYLERTQADVCGIVQIAVFPYF